MLLKKRLCTQNVHIFRIYTQKWSFFLTYCVLKSKRQHRKTPQINYCKVQDDREGHGKSIKGFHRNMCKLSVRHCHWEKDRDTETEREISERDRQTETQKDTQRKREREKILFYYTGIKRERERSQRDRQTDRDRQRQRERQTKRERLKLKDIMFWRQPVLAKLPLQNNYYRCTQPYKTTAASTM